MKSQPEPRSTAPTPLLLTLSRGFDTVAVGLGPSVLAGAGAGLSSGFAVGTAPVTR